MILLVVINLLIYLFKMLILSIGLVTVLGLLEVRLRINKVVMRGLSNFLRDVLKMVFKE